jgi:hypothetical protein
MASEDPPQQEPIERAPATDPDRDANYDFDDNEPEEP